MSVTINTQCVATTNDGIRCHRITARGNMCPQHLESIQGLKIAPSLIPNAGYGLFTTCERKRGDNIVRYTGLIVIELEPEDGEEDVLYDGDYVLEVKKTYPRVSIDARQSVNTGGFVNAPRGTTKQTNVQFSYDKRKQIAWVRATKKILAGAELLVGYGGGYWRAQKNRNIL
jgi:hypothetical protein